MTTVVGLYFTREVIQKIRRWRTQPEPLGYRAIAAQLGFPGNPHAAQKVKERCRQLGLTGTRGPVPRKVE